MPTSQKLPKWAFALMGFIALIFVGLIALPLAIPSMVRGYMDHQSEKDAPRQSALSTMFSISLKASTYHMMNCKFPPSAWPSGEVPTGNPVPMRFSGTGWDELELDISEPQYFAFETENRGDSYVITAKAQLHPDRGPQTITQTLRRQKDGCLAASDEIAYTGEF